MGFVNAPVHDLLIRIKNALMARKELITWVIYSNFKKDILELLKRYNFIKDYEVVQVDKKRFINIYLNKVYNSVNDIPVVNFYSKPSKRVYVSTNQLSNVAWWKWISIISTSKWVLSNKEALETKVWWELIASIY